MASYELVFKKSVAKDLRRLPNEDVRRILERIRSLAEEPRPFGSEKLSGLERYRIRVGICRVIYEIQDRILMVLVVKVAHRSDVYRPK